MRVCAIDPGVNAGIVLVEFNGYATPVVLAKGVDVLGDQYDVVVCEAQFPNPKAGRQSLISLGVTAGFLMGLYSTQGETPTYRVPVADWRRALWGTPGQEPKRVTVARLQKLAYHGLWLETEDEWEAFGIAVAAHRMGAELEKHRWPKAKAKRAKKPAAFS